MRYILNEAKLSRNLAAPFIKAFNQLGLTESEANYFMNLFGELRQKNLLNSNLFTPVKPDDETADYAEFVLNYEGKLPDLKQLQVLAKDPDTLLDVFNYIINNPKFLNAYNVEVTEDDVKIEKKKVEKADVNKITNKAHYTEVPPVAEDENWVTYSPIDNAECIKLADNYFMKNVTAEEKRILNNNPENFRFDWLLPRWCIAKKGSWFTSQKVDKKNDRWLITFTKKRPIEIYNQYIKGKFNFNHSSAQVNFENFAENVGDKYVGEVFLKNTQGETPIGHGNYGYHLYVNRGRVQSQSSLQPKPSYDYETLETYRPIVITGTDLERYHVNEETLVIPHGVRTIHKGALKNLDKVERIILPITTLYIKKGAIQNLPKLKSIETSNNFVALEEGALDSIVSKENIKYNGVVRFGVYDKEHDIFRKPARLKYMQSNLLREYKNVGEE